MGKESGKNAPSSEDLEFLHPLMTPKEIPVQPQDRQERPDSVLVLQEQTTEHNKIKQMLRQQASG